MIRRSYETQEVERNVKTPLPALSTPVAGETAAVRRELTRLVQAVFLSWERRRSVIFTGAESGVGCSWVCAHAAELLADCRLGSVCLIDANLRAPALDSRFGVRPVPGFAELVAGTVPARQFARCVRDELLWLVPCGSSPADPRALLNSDRAKARILELRSTFDFVLIDTACSDPHWGGAALGEVTDGCVLVIDCNSTPSDAVLAAKKALQAANVGILGAVLNRKTP